MTKIYRLHSDMNNYSIFNEVLSKEQENIKSLTMEQHWKELSNYTPVSLELLRSNAGHKNYKLDFSSFLSPFLVFSEKAINNLKDILEPRGQFLDVITESKRKKFIGYYPTNVYSKGILDLSKSKYDEYPLGLLIHKPVLIKEKIPDEYLFTIEEDVLRIFATEKFKKLVEDNNLVGFEFSEYNEVELSSYK